MSLDEFALIDRLQGIINASAAQPVPPGCVFIGDDAAVLPMDKDRQLVVTTDTLVSGVHFPAGTAPEEIGYKALAVNLSDLAAMGAQPAWFFLALTLPEANTAWLDPFAAGMGELARDSGAILAGGDTTSGPLSITITALGRVERGKALLRSTARAGDLVVISGTPGLAAFGLDQVLHANSVDEAALRALNRPVPRLALGRCLGGKATACIDVSDGLAADLGHIAGASCLGAEIMLGQLPCAPSMQQLKSERRWELQLGGGDDFELCFTLPPELEPELPFLAAAGEVSLTVVGSMTSSEGLVFSRPDGRRFVPRRTGFMHFSQRKN